MNLSKRDPFGNRGEDATSKPIPLGNDLCSPAVKSFGKHVAQKVTYRPKLERYVRSGLTVMARVSGSEE